MDSTLKWVIGTVLGFFLFVVLMFVGIDTLYKSINNCPDEGAISSVNNTLVCKNHVWTYLPTPTPNSETESPNPDYPNATRFTNPRWQCDTASTPNIWWSSKLRHEISEGVRGEKIVCKKPSYADSVVESTTVTYFYNIDVSGQDSRQTIRAYDESFWWNVNPKRKYWCMAWPHYPDKCLP